MALLWGGADPYRRAEGLLERPPRRPQADAEESSEEDEEEGDDEAGEEDEEEGFEIGGGYDDGDGDGGSRNHDHIHLLVDLWAPSAGDRVVCKRISYYLHMAYHTRSRVDRSRTPPRDFFSLAGALIVPRRLIETFNSDCGGDLWPGLM